MASKKRKREDSTKDEKDTKCEDELERAICTDEPGATLGARLASRAKKRKRHYVKHTFREHVWPKLLKLLAKAADDGQTRVHATFAELGIKESMDDSPFVALIEENINGKDIEIDDVDEESITLVF